MKKKHLSYAFESEKSAQQNSYVLELVQTETIL